MSSMNSLERVVAAIKLEKPDRVPVTPLIISRALRVLGYTTEQCLFDPEKMSEAKVASSEKFDDDSVVVGTDLFVEAECMGSKVTVYEHTPVVTEYFIKEKSDIDKLRVPNPNTDGRMPFVCKEIELIKQKVGDTRVVVPVTGGPVTQASQLYGPEQCLFDPEKMSEAKVASSEKFDDDSVVVGTDLFVEAECMGSKVTVYEHTPVVTEYFIKEKSDIDKLRVPNPNTDGRMPFVRKEIELIKQKVGDTRVVVPVTGGPVTQASQLYGPEQLLFAMIEDPDWVHKLLRICTDAALTYWNALIKAGAHAIVLLEPFSANTILSPEQYDEFTAPYCKEIFENAWSQGVVGVNHICADTSLIWDKMASVGALGLQVDHVIDMADAKAAVGDKICISGNVHPVDYMLFGTPQEVYWKSREVIEKAANGSGFVLGSGCDLNPNTPEENIFAMIQAGKEAVYNDDLTISFAQESYPRPEA